MTDIEWNPIGTAPRDGSDLLLAFDTSPAINWPTFGRFGRFVGGRWVHVNDKHAPFEVDGHEITGWLPLSEHHQKAAGLDDRQLAAIFADVPRGS